MTAPVTLLMAVHCHQPVGNFDFVLEQASAKAYEPFVTVLERHPSVRLALHYSGCLLDWLARHRPEFVRRVRALADRGQIELLASGYAEPILPLLPEPDRQGQIAMMRTLLRRRLGTDATGLWLTERVWEPELPQTLARAGIQYTMVDTNQFATAKPWLPATHQIDDGTFWDVLGCYTTEYAGSSILLFPASKRLRYWMPFQSVEQTIEFLRRLQREEPVAITFADDGEKFGLWPKTYQWVYEHGWLDQFFTAVERERGWLSTATFRDYAAQVGPSGRVYLPTGSYEEMLDWSGGQFRNFFVKYPESHAMQQAMLRVSEALCALRDGRAGSKRVSVVVDGRRVSWDELVEQATRELYLGQCNCAYWHGVFGGLYLAHLRRAIWRHLITAERLTHQASGHTAFVTAVDSDGDGQPEAEIHTPFMSLQVDPADGGTITAWHLYRSGVNVVDTLTRRYEPYHDKLRHHVDSRSAGSQPASIHETLGVKEQNLDTHLVYDDHRRSLFVDYALQQMPTLEAIVGSTWGEQRLWSGGRFEWRRRFGAATKGNAGREQRHDRTARTEELTVHMVRPLPGGQIRKTVRVPAGRPSVECCYQLDHADIPVIALECTVGLRDDRYLQQPGLTSQASEFVIREPDGVTLTLSIEPAAQVVHFPIQTVSESEEGLERTYQGLCVVCCWALDGAKSWTGRLRWTAKDA